MKKLYVYADFDWLKEIELIGELGYESLRGSDSYSFKFADSWIKKYNAITLSEDLNNFLGYNTLNQIKIFSVALPMHCLTDGAHSPSPSGTDLGTRGESPYSPTFIV